MDRQRLALVFFVSVTAGVLADPPRRAGPSQSNLSSLAATPIPRQLTYEGCFKQRPMWSPDGKRLLFTRHQGTKIALVILDLATGKEQRVGPYEHPQFDAAWSPSGTKIACTRTLISGTQGDMDLYIMAPDGAHATPIAKTEGKLSHEEWASWSPDGKRVVFSSTKPGNQEIHLVDPDGKNLIRITQHPGTDAHPAWSPDGRTIAFATDRWGGLEIALMNPDGTNVHRLTHSRGLDDYPAWSPDGGRIAWVTNRDGNYEIYVMDADGTAPINISRSPAVDTYPSWSPDGRSIVFVSDRSQGFDLYVADIPPPAASQGTAKPLATRTN